MAKIAGREAGVRVQCASATTTYYHIDWDLWKSIQERPLCLFWLLHSSRWHGLTVVSGALALVLPTKVPASLLASASHAATSVDGLVDTPRPEYQNYPHPPIPEANRS